jgi:hypothetical protein
VWQALLVAVVVVGGHQNMCVFCLLVLSQQRDNPEFALHGTERHGMAWHGTSS